MFIHLRAEVLKGEPTMLGQGTVMEHMVISISLLQRHSIAKSEAWVKNRQQSVGSKGWIEKSRIYTQR